MTAAPTPEQAVEALRALDLFEGLSEERLERLAAEGEPRLVEAGELFWGENEPAPAFNVLIEGVAEWSRTIAGERVVLGRREAPPLSYMGATNILTEEPTNATGQAATACSIVAFEPEVFRALMQEERVVFRRVVALIAPLYQALESAVQRREKLASLGSLSAGLAHEINNPAAAAGRAADALAEALEAMRASVRGLAGFDPRTLAAVVDLADEAASRDPASREEVDALEASDREEALADWLDDRGVPDPHRTAGELAEAGLEMSWLERLETATGAYAVPAAAPFLAASATAADLTGELSEAVGRVSDLVQAMKEYSYMDQASVQEVDLHQGLESTLKILGHKARRAAVAIERDYDRSIPRITAAGSELNQVWTNLIDNAIAAAPGGHVRISTSADGDHVRVVVADDGAGIAAENQGRVFDPFFTTKDVGQGTGLGLDLARRVVEERHGGDIRLESEPGMTRFEVSLPARRG